MKELVYLLLILGSLTGLGQSGNIRLIGYLPTWGDFSGEVSKVNFGRFTHINLAFANPDESGTVTFPELQPDQVTAVIAKCHAANCLISVSIGGGAADIDLWLKYMSPEFRNTVIQSLVDLVVDYGFDGIDVDLEGDLVLSADYQGFVEALYAQLPEGVGYTAALATWSAGGLTTELLELYDFVNIMSYDYAGPWAPDKPGPHSSYAQAVSDLTYWKETKGLQADKVVLGVPFYGYQFQDDEHVFYKAYKEILADNPGAESSDQVGSTYYNGVATIRAKTELALDVGGIMIWEITQDVDFEDSRSLLAAINSIMYPDVLGVENTNQESMAIYPNPVRDTLKLTPEFTASFVKIMDPEGRVIMEVEVSNGEVNVKPLVNGVYLAAANVDGKEMWVRFVKQQ